MPDAKYHLKKNETGEMLTIQLKFCATRIFGTTICHSFDGIDNDLLGKAVSLTFSLYLIAIISPLVKQANDLSAFSKLYTNKLTEIIYTQSTTK